MDWAILPATTDATNDGSFCHGRLRILSFPKIPEPMDIAKPWSNGRAYDSGPTGPEFETRLSQPDFSLSKGMNRYCNN